MFHHFHHEGEKPHAQGSITALQLENIIKYVGCNNILPAQLWLEKARSDKLLEKDVCITLDDGLKCQIEIANPVLKKFNLTAFWFVFSSVFNGDICSLEIYRYFYNLYFPNFDAFFKVFKSYFVEKKTNGLYKQYHGSFMASEYLREFDFYTPNEREYRYFRDVALSQNEFESIMDSILQDHNVDKSEVAKHLWLKDMDLISLDKDHHVIGLHSYHHPTNMKQLSRNEQEEEFRRNQEHIFSVLGKQAESVAHPCGSYSSTTLRVLEELEIKVGFRSNFSKLNHTRLDYPRVDHCHLLSEAENTKECDEN